MLMPKTDVKILDGRKIREAYEEALQKQIDSAKKTWGSRFALKLTTIQVGESKDVDLYCNCLVRLFGRFGIPLSSKKFSGKDSPENVLLDILKVTRTRPRPAF